VSKKNIEQSLQISDQSQLFPDKTTTQNFRILLKKKLTLQQVVLRCGQLFGEFLQLLLLFALFLKTNNYSA
jgi:hypothetical protein